MTTTPPVNGQNQVVIYTAGDGTLQVDVRLRDQSLWLSLDQISTLFGRDKSVISRHIKNIFKTAELSQDSVVANFATTAADGKTYDVNFYNLDMILSVGYRVNSKRGTQFRIWANDVLRRHLVEGYTLHQKRLAEKGMKNLEQALTLVRETSMHPELTGDQAKGLLKVITGYAQTWVLLHQYDEGKVAAPRTLRPARYQLSYEDAIDAIRGLQETLQRAGEASTLFGQERDNALRGILGNIEQTFDGRELYASAEEKAAHLLYFIIKDHPLSDGNKRVGVLLFLLFLDRNGILKPGLFDDATLVALALLIAESRPQQKDILLQIILRFISASQ
jgi:prophage maintenance system killer protein